MDKDKILDKKDDDITNIQDKIKYLNFAIDHEKRANGLIPAKQESKIVFNNNKYNRKIIGIYSEPMAQLYGSFIWTIENGQEIKVTEVAYEGVPHLTLALQSKYVGYVKKFVKHLCPTMEDKQCNCFCKSLSGISFS